MLGAYAIVVVSYHVVVGVVVGDVVGVVTDGDDDVGGVGGGVITICC